MKRPPETAKFYGSLQSARALAVVLVVYYHAVLQLYRNFIGIPPGHVLLGKCGVDIFFVISGFIIWSTSAVFGSDLWMFYRKRLARIVPLYWVLSSLVALIALLLPAMLMSTKFEVSHFLASLAFLPWPNPATKGSTSDYLTPIIVPGWTLNYEMMFYAVFGLSMVMRRSLQIFTLLVEFLMILLILSLVSQRIPILSFYDPLLVMEFLLGVAIAKLAEDGVVLPIKAAVCVTLAAAVVLVALDSIEPPIHRFFYLGIPSCLLVYGLISIETPGSWKQIGLFTLIGDASYSIYLTHIFTLAFLRVLCSKAAFSGGRLFGICFVLTSLVGSVFIGLLVYKLIEGPLVRGANQILGLRSGNRARRRPMQVDV